MMKNLRKYHFLVGISGSLFWNTGHPQQPPGSMVHKLMEPSPTYRRSRNLFRVQSGIEENLLQGGDSTEVYFNNACIDANGPQWVKAARVFINRPQSVWHSAAAAMRINLSSLHSGS